MPGAMEGMLAAVMRDVGRLDLTHIPIPTIRPGCVRVKLDYVGVCGSDLHLFENGYLGAVRVDKPMVLGHEPAGVVTEVGEGVTALEPGDRVAVEPGVPCWHCEFCKAGKYNLCRSVFFYASPPVTQGCFVESIVHPAELCFKLPDNVTTLEGALIEPLAVGLHAAMQSGVCMGATAVVIGAGCIGLVTAMALRSMGVARVIMVDLVKNRLDRALQLSATDVINASECDPVERIREMTGGGAPYVFETSGSPVGIRQTAHLVRRGGTITLVGYTKEGQATMDVNWIIDNELTIKTVFRYRNLYPTAINAVSAGIIPLKAIVSDIFDFSEIQKGMEYAAHNKDQVVKCVIRINPEA